MNFLASFLINHGAKLSWKKGAFRSKDGTHLTWIKGTPSSSIGTATLVGYGLLNYC